MNTENEEVYTKQDVKKIIKETIMITSLIFLLVMSIIYFCVLIYSIYIKEDNTKDFNLQKYMHIIELYEDNYVGDIDLTTSVDESISGLVQSMGDKYGYYIPVSDGSTVGAEFLTGNYQGIGITFALVDNYLEVYDIVKDSPAGKSDIKVGDKIVKLNGEDISISVYEKFKNDISSKILEKVVFTLNTGEEIEIIIGEVKTPKLDWVISHNVAYIYIYNFVPETFELFKDCLNQIVGDDEITDLVFDLRNNTGGNAETVVSMLDYILDDCLLMTIDYKNSESEDEYFYSDSSTVLTKDYNVKVVVNRRTASAAELFTAVIKEYFDATIIGETTYGKGTVVSSYSFTDGSILLMSSGYYTIPNGSNIEGVGITPDIILDEEHLTLSVRELDRLKLLENY